VNWTTRECYGQSSKANPILSENTDCTQSTDYLHTKPDLLANLDGCGFSNPRERCCFSSASYAGSQPRWRDVLLIFPAIMTESGYYR
jgi:hypothetical protein